MYHGRFNCKFCFLVYDKDISDIQRHSSRVAIGPGEPGKVGDVLEFYWSWRDPGNGLVFHVIVRELLEFFLNSIVRIA